MAIVYECDIPGCRKVTTEENQVTCILRVNHITAGESGSIYFCEGHKMEAIEVAHQKALEATKAGEAAKEVYEPALSTMELTVEEVSLNDLGGGWVVG